MNGTIITDVKVYSAAGSLVMQAQVGDKVEGPGTALINRLTRNGIQKLAGTYYLGQTGCVAWDTVTPPPDPTVTEVIEYHRTENGVTTVTRFIPE